MCPIQPGRSTLRPRPRTQTQVNHVQLLVSNGFLMRWIRVAPSHSNAEVQDEEQIARNVQALKNRLRGRGGTPGRRGRGRTDVGSGRESLPGSEYVIMISSANPPI